MTSQSEIQLGKKGLTSEFIKDLEKRKVYCEHEKMYITNLMKCKIACPYGHITECHYPYTCNSEYCNHYHYEEE